MPRHIAILISLVLIACQGQSDDTVNPSEPVDERAGLTCPTSGRPFSVGADALTSDFQGLKLHLENYSQTPDRSRPAEYQPEHILGRLHPWLKTALCAREWQGQRVFVLAPVPDELIKDIASVTSGLYKNGIGILNAQFWKDVQSMQKEGLRVAFLEFSPEFEVSGVYHSAEEFIGLDVFANPGTTHHERRHHLQHKALAQVAAGWVRRDPVSGQCATQVSRFFGELDSTTVQLPHWLKTFDGVEIESVLADPQPTLRLYPQKAFLYANLDYPGFASTWTKNKGCPMDLERAIAEITSKTNKALTEITAKAERLIGTHAVVVNLARQIRKQCPHGAANASATCGMLHQRATRMVAEANALKHEINSRIEAEAAARPLYIKEALKKMDRRTQYSLARKSGGYILLTN